MVSRTVHTVHVYTYNTAYSILQLDTCSPPCTCAHILTHTHTPPPHPKLAIILNPSPAWIIPDNPKLILVNSGHSSAGFHPETTETGWGLVGSCRLRVGAPLIDIIGRGSDRGTKKNKHRFSWVFNICPDWPFYVTYCCRCFWPKTCFSAESSVLTVYH